MSEVNIPLLRKAVEWVEEQDKLPEAEREWDQTTWASARFTNPNDPDSIYDERMLGSGDYYMSWDEIQKLAEQRGLKCGTAYCVAGWIGQQTDSAYKLSWNPPGKLPVDDFAADVLGLTAEQADELFDEDNSAADVRSIAEGIAGEKL
jgi:hypothetical protein